MCPEVRDLPVHPSVVRCVSKEKTKSLAESKCNSLSLFERAPLTDCLKDIDLIPPFNRMLLEVTFGKLYAWAVQNIRNVLMDANAKFKELGELNPCV